MIQHYTAEYKPVGCVLYILFNTRSVHTPRKWDTICMMKISICSTNKRDNICNPNGASGWCLTVNSKTMHLCLVVASKYVISDLWIWNKKRMQWPRKKVLHRHHYRGSEKGLEHTKKCSSEPRAIIAMFRVISIRRQRT